MKTSHLVAAGVVVGALILIAKSRKPGMGGMGDGDMPFGDGDMLVPPPGRTVTSSGQVLGGLGLETRFIDSYDANPSQYRREVINDLIPGIGAAIGRSGTRGRSLFGSLFSKMNKDREEAAAKEKARLAEEERLKQIEAIAQRKVNETLLAIQKQAEADMAAQQGIVAPPTPTAEVSGGKGKWGIVMMQARHVGAKPWWRAEKGAGTMTEQEAVKAAFAKTAESNRKVEKSAYEMPINTDKHPPSNYDQAKQAYDVVAAAREQASMSQASSDTGYGATQQVTEEGAPQIPEQVAQVQTPSAQMLPPMEAAPAPTGNSKVGLIVGGGVLAAIAAALAS